MKFKERLIYFTLGCVFLVTGCASMDLRVDTLRSDANYGKIKPRIEFKDFRYFTGEPGKPYIKLAELIAQETPDVLLTRLTDGMIAHICKIAWKNGADALINVNISTTNVAGRTRVSPVVRGTAIRYKE